jgi:uncharacterized membrane protein YkoI
MKRTALAIAALIVACAPPLAAQAGVRAPARIEARMEARAEARLEAPAARLIDIQDRLIPLPQIIAQLRGRGGEYVSANVTEQGGRTVYWVRMRYAGGRFVDYTVDAHTGQILSEQGG